MIAALKPRLLLLPAALGIDRTLGMNYTVDIDFSTALIAGATHLGNQSSIFGIYSTNSSTNESDSTSTLTITTTPRVTTTSTITVTLTGATETKETAEFGHGTPYSAAELPPTVTVTETITISDQSIPYASIVAVSSISPSPDSKDTIADAVLTSVSPYMVPTHIAVRGVFPATVGSATLNGCDASYVVQPGDICQYIWEKNSITQETLLSLNPQLNGSCEFLQVGQVLCVPHEDNTASSPVLPAPATLTTPLVAGTPVSGAAGPVAPCSSNYTISSGDTCNEIWTNVKLTQNEFFQLNPSLFIAGDGNCPIQVGQVVCVKSGTVGNDGPTQGPAASAAADHGPKGLPGFQPPEILASPTSAQTGGLSIIPIHSSPTTVNLLRWLPMTFRTSTRRE